MSAPTPLEIEILDSPESILDSATGGLGPRAAKEARFRILERVATLYAGLEVGAFKGLFPDGESIPAGIVNSTAAKLLERLVCGPISIPIALSSLARPHMTEHQRKQSGSYYTDFRLAEFLASRLPEAGASPPRVLDPASGTGILLVASALKYFPRPSRERDDFLSKCIFAADLSPDALRGALIAIGSLCSDSKTLRALAGHLRCGDSLLFKKALWNDVVTGGFDVVIGNPPWEKLKVSAHEVLLDRGVERLYGQALDSIGKHSTHIETAKVERSGYAAKLKEQYFFQGEGEPDLYKYFLELSVELLAAGGTLAVFVPGGLIRSQGTYPLRKLLTESSSKVSYTILDNKSRFFSIDTRFKFLLILAHLEDQPLPAEICVEKGTGTELSVRSEQAATFQVSELRPIRADYSIPEVRNEREWALFRDISKRLLKFGDTSAHWQPRFCREVDMTRDKEKFCSSPGKGRIPLIEGRMVHQYHSTAKAHVGGQGRSAEWRSTYFEKRRVYRPQFWYATNQLPQEVQKRVSLGRVGFCDITGQTNERSLLSSWIPPGVVCGNKVPTILFRSQVEQQTIGNAWLGIANSFVFDWLLRRVLTTTVNYFLLLDLPVPSFDKKHADIMRLSRLGKKLSLADPSQKWAYARMRADADIAVARLYGVDFLSLKLILSDFPLLDRAQPAIFDERRSTITTDFLLLRFADTEKENSEISNLRSRVEEAVSKGAAPYVPSHL